MLAPSSPKEVIVRPSRLHIGLPGGNNKEGMKGWEYFCPRVDP
jgi:hypothetical protein